MSKEITNIIRKYYGAPAMTEEECEKHREQHCSIWDSIEEIKKDFEQDIDYELTIDRLKEMDNITQLADGTWFVIY